MYNWSTLIGIFKGPHKLIIISYEINCPIIEAIINFIQNVILFIITNKFWILVYESICISKSGFSRQVIISFFYIVTEPQIKNQIKLNKDLLLQGIRKH